jgi:hypothetical protein
MARKYDYIYVLQGFYAQGWEDLTASAKRSEMVADRNAYRANEGGSYRIIQRRVLRNESNDSGVESTQKVD